MIGTDTCAQPDDPVPELLRPVVSRVARSGPRSWRVTCGLDELQCRLVASTKRDALIFTTGEGLRRWLAMAGDIAVATEVVIAAHCPAIACGRYQAEPFDPSHDLGDGRGNWPTCGEPITRGLGDVADLVMHRLGWDAERYRRSLTFDPYSADATRRRCAWVDAAADLKAGDLLTAEIAAVHATPVTLMYLGLEQLDELRRRQHAMDRRQAAAYWTSSAAASTCWAPSLQCPAPGPRASAEERS